MDEIGSQAQAREPLARDWTQGNIFHNLLRLSWPMVVSSSLNMVGPTIDMIWVGRLGSTSIAAVGVAGIVVMLIAQAIMGLTIGVRAMVARSIGAGDYKGANHAALQSFVAALFFVLLITLIGFFLSDKILGLFGLEPEVLAQGSQYLRIVLLGSVAMFLRMMAEGVMQASGDSVAPMRIALIYRIFHVALCPFLIFGWWIFPRMEIEGAALTNVISHSLGLALSMWVLFSGRSRLKITLRNFKIDPVTIWQMIRIGVPASIMGIQQGLGNFILVKFIVPFGTFAIAAHTVCQRIEMILLMPCLGLGMAAGVLAGQNLGAGKPERGERSTWIAAGLAEIFMFVVCIALLIWAENIVRIFNTEPEMVAYAAAFLRIATAGYAVIGLIIVLQNCLIGVGDTIPAMLFSILIVWLVQFPLAFYLPQITGLGVIAIRWSIVIAIVTGTISYTIYFKTGRWKRKRL